MSTHTHAPAPARAAPEAGHQFPGLRGEVSPMSQRPSTLATGAARGWRALRTGLAFAVFGAGALLVAALVFPALRLGAGAVEVRELRAQRIIHLTFGWFARFMECLGLIRVRRVGTERLRQRPTLVIANHPTLIDVVLLIACMPQADCVVKRAAWRNRFLRGVVAGAGYIRNDDGDALVRACSSRLRAGRSVLLFPEGTRSPRGGLGRFQRGAARIAVDSGCPLVPVVITCHPPTLMKGQRWYDVPDRPADLTIRVEAAIAPPPADGMAQPALVARRLTDAARTLYERRLGHVDA